MRPKVLFFAKTRNKSYTLASIRGNSSVGLLSIALGITLGLSAIYSGVGIAKADSVIATIPVGPTPRAVAFNPSNDDMYVINVVGGGNNSTISVIDSSTNRVVDTITAGVSSTAIAFNPINKGMYVTNLESNTVSVIDSSTNHVVNTIHVGKGPVGIAFNPKNEDMYVTNSGVYGSNSVSVIDGSTNEVTATIHLGPFPFAVGFNPKNGDMYITDASQGVVYVVDSSTNAVLGTVRVGGFPQSLAFAPSNGNIYVANGGSNTVSVIDRFTVIATTTVGITPFGIAFNPNNRNVYVSNAGRLTGSDFVSVIDSSTNQVVGNIIVGTNPAGIAFDPANGDIYVTNARDNTVSVISTLGLKPSHTTITSAIDGNGAEIPDVGTTTSNSITFTLSAVAGTYPITGFQCSIDNSQLSSCTSPVALHNLAAGPHRFTAVAVDTAGNRDPTPARFSWTILTPALGIEQLIQTINGMHLNPGTQANLDAQLNGVLTTLSLPIKNNLLSTCPHLNAFVSTVIPDYMHAGQLSPNQAAQIIQSAQNIQKALGCE